MRATTATIASFGALLRKEVREAMPVTIAVVALTLLCAWWTADRAYHLQATLILAVLTTLFGLGTDMIAGERRNGTIALLRRLPTHPSLVLFAKLATLLVVLTGATVLAVSVCAGSDWLPKLADHAVYNVVAVLGILGWLLCASSLLRRSSLVLACTAAIVLGLILWIRFTIGTIPGAPRDAWLAAAVGLGVLAGLFSAWRALRGVTPPRTSALLVGGAVCMFVVVTSVVFAVDRHAMRWAKPFDAPFMITSATLSMDRKTAWLMTTNGREAQAHVLTVDLETGEWEQFVDGVAYCMSGDEVRRVATYAMPRRSPVVVVGRYHERNASRLVDTGTGRTITRFVDRSAKTMAALESRFGPDVDAERTLLRTHGGERWWTRGPTGSDNLHAIVRGLDGSVRARLEWSSMSRPTIVTGTGLMGITGTKREYFDVDRGRAFVLPERYRYARVRSGSWIVFPKTPKKPFIARTELPPMRWDPATGETKEIVGYRKRDTIHVCLGDSLLVSNGDEKSLLTLDPRTGERRPLARGGKWFGGYIYSPGIVHPVGDKRFLILGSTAGPSRLLRYDVSSGEFDFLDWRSVDRLGRQGGVEEILDVETQNSVLVRSSCSLFRVRFGEPAVERLWPRSEAQR